MAKENTTKQVLAEAKDEIFEGKSKTVKNHFQSLIGTSDGIKARLSITIKNIEKELADNEAKIAHFASLSVDDAYNEIIYTQRPIKCSNSPTWDFLNQSISNLPNQYTLA